MPYKLPKSARLCGVSDTAALFAGGSHFSVGPVRATFLLDQSSQKVLVSAPKRLFKRAVDRNLLKRRLREAFRLHRSLLGGQAVHLALSYASGRIKPYKDIEDAVCKILERVGGAARLASGAQGDSVVVSQNAAVGVDRDSGSSC